MAAGLSLPIRAINGRAAIESGEAQLKKIIMLAIADCDSGNPYQELGIDTLIVFALDDQQVKAFARRRIVDAFKRMEAEGRAQLDGDAPTFSSKDGELTCQIKYINLETTAAEELELRGASPFELYRSLTTRSP